MWGENRDGMALAKPLTFSFCLSVRTFPDLNSGDPDTLLLSPWKHLDMPYLSPTKTWANMRKSFQCVGHDLSIHKCHMINQKCQNMNCVSQNESANTSEKHHHRIITRPMTLLNQNSMKTRFAGGITQKKQLMQTFILHVILQWL